MHRPFLARRKTELNSTYVLKETVRESAFESVWANDIDDGFADVAPYYDRACFRHVRPYRQTACAFHFRDRRSVRTESARCLRGDQCDRHRPLGKRPDLEVHAADRSVAMQKVGRTRARLLGFDIKSHICDVHRLPFPDSHFDVVTLQWATRHLRVIDEASEIKRVHKPGGYFHQCDMLRPANKMVDNAY
jgi:demethylmenaquinone methyltransferase/2-methoxy-6-polyprenyl-1,4-benzoquinol methylase